MFSKIVWPCVGIDLKIGLKLNQLMVPFPISFDPNQTVFEICFLIFEPKNPFIFGEFPVFKIGLKSPFEVNKVLEVFKIYGKKTYKSLD